MQTIPKILPYGRFFGASKLQIEVPGFSVSLLTPALRSEDVPVHEHADASFVFLLSGTYFSEADGAPPVCPPSTLIFNPLGDHSSRPVRVGFRPISYGPQPRRN